MRYARKTSNLAQKRKETEEENAGDECQRDLVTQKDSPSHPIGAEVRALPLFPHFSFFRVSDLCVVVYPLDSPLLLFRVAIERSFCHSPFFLFLLANLMQQRQAAFRARIQSLITKQGQCE